jgi:hypothetical protein
MITVLSILACSLTMVMSWLLSQGRLKAVYVLGIVNSLCFIVLNGSLAVSGQPGILFLIVPSAWGIVTSFIGLRRLSKGERNGKESTTDA